MSEREPIMSEQQNLAEQIRKAGFIFTCGNGGSAANAEHFSNDLFKKGYKAICLNSNVSVMTMIANDYGYSGIFSRQLETYAIEGDLLITISCSGTSSNIIAALVKAREMRIKTYEFETFKDGDRNFGLLEDKHLKFAHAVAKLL